LKKYLSILFLFCTFSINAQTYTYSYTDPCTGVLKSLSVPINGSIAVSYYGETSSFTGNDFQNGTFENWANQVLAQYQNISPCAQIVGVTTAVNVSQSTVLNTIGILNSLSALSDLAGSTNILGGATTTVSGGTNNNSNNKQNKNGNNSNNSNGGNTSASGSNGTGTTSSNPTTNPSGTSSTSTTSSSGSNQQGNGTSSTGSGENGGTTSSTGTEGGTSGGSTTTNPEGQTINPGSEPTSSTSSSTTTGTSGEGNPENPQTSSGTEGTGSTGSVTGNGSTGGNVTSGGNGETQTQETPTTQEETGKTNVTGGSTNTIKGSTTTSNSSKNKEGGKPSVVASSDFVGFNFRDSDVTTGLKVTGGYTSLRWDGKRSWGVLADYTSALKGPNITGFYAILKPKTTTILSGTLTIGFEGIGSLYGTISGGQMFSFKKVKSLKVIYMATVSYGAVFRTQFLGTAVIAGGMYDLKIGKRIDIKLTNLMVYSPYVSYYNDLVLASPFVMLPSVGTNIGITKKFKFNINAGGAWSLGNSTLNYTITCGTRLMVGQ